MPLQTILDFLSERPNCRVALVVHQRPDGDAIGSGMGMAMVLREQGYRPKLVNPLPLPLNLAFLVDDDLRLVTEDPEWWREFDCVGALDFGDPVRADEANRTAFANLPAFNIDHHVTSSGIGDAAWVEPGASSTGEMCVRLCRTAGWPIPPRAALAFWTAIVTDTGRFSQENATPDSLAAGRECLLAGANPTITAQEIYQSVSYAERRLQARVLERLEMHAGGRLAISWLRHDDFREAGIGVEGAQDLINLVRDTAGVEVAVFLYEPAGAAPGSPAPVKISLRTRPPHSALAIAVKHGGGGHVRAAGASIDQPLDAARRIVLEEARSAYFNAAL